MNYERKYYQLDPQVSKLKTVKDLLDYAVKRYASKIAYQQIESKYYESAITFRGLNDNVKAIGTSMLLRGLQGKHIALLGETSIEWVISYLAILNGVGVVVPLDLELNGETLVKQLTFGDVEAIVCSQRGYKKLKRILNQCPNITDIVVIRNQEEFETDVDITQHLFLEMLKEGKDALQNKDTSYIDIAIDPDAMSELVFTSGTTGANKGVMLCHRNIISALQGAKKLVGYLNSSMSVLPANHTYELTCHLCAGILEGTTVYINDDLRHVAKNMEHFAPEMLCMVPMMVNAIVRKVKVEAEKSNLSKHLNYGMRVSNALRKIGIDQRKHFFKPILENFGGNLTKIICGGAPLEQYLVDFMDAIGITVLNGYGITECAPLVAVNGDHMRKKNSVGHVLPTCQVRIDSPDENGNGEIQVKGGNVMLGYYKMPEDTACVFTEDGWFKTGDIGHLDKDKFLYINGRVKNLIILANGKNIYPEELETALEKEIAYVKESVVYTDEAGTGIYAICFLDDQYCQANNLLDYDTQYQYLLADIQKYNKKMPSFKRINDVKISCREFEKTSTRKIKRFKVIEGRDKYVRES